MMEFRKVLIEDRPFHDFELYCNECGSTFVELEDLTGSPFKDEVLIQYEITEHAFETGHHSVGGAIDPMASLEEIDLTITVNDGST